MRSSVDAPAAVATDIAGNVFVTGKSEGMGTAYDFLTVKFDQNGNQLWSRRYDGWQHGFDIPVAIATDGAGNVYVTGVSDGPDTSSTDIVTIKYSGGGTVRWIAQYDGPVSHTPWGLQSSPDAVADMAVDNSGNVYITGNQGAWLTNFLTLKYNTDGVEEWANAFDGPLHSEDKATALALDPDGNILVTGWTWDSTSAPIDFQTNYTIIKYSPYGEQLWNVTHSIEGVNSLPKDIVVAVDGSVYVTGDVFQYDYQYGYFFADVLTVKYNSEGSHLWSDTFGTGEIESAITAIRDIAIGMEIDGNGHVYVAAVSGWEHSRSSPQGDSLITIQYDPAGTRNWVRFHDGGEGTQVRHAGLDVGQDGNVFVYALDGEWEHPFVSLSALIVEYSSIGDVRWEEHHALSFEDPLIFNGIQVDNSGNILVIAPTGSPLQSNLQVSKYSPNGLQMWTASADGEGSMSGFTRAAVVDQLGNTVVTCAAMDSTGKRDFVTAKYNPLGQQLWFSTYKGAAGGDDEPNAIDTDNNGNVCISGTSAGLETGSDYLTIKYSPDGDELWTARFNNSSEDLVGAMSIASDGGIVVVGYPSIAKYDQDGLLLWSIATPDFMSTLLAIDSSGNIVTVQEEWYGGDKQLVKLDADGELLWSHQFPSWSNSSIQDLVIDDEQAMYITSRGSYTDSTFKFDASGSRMWGLGVGGNDIEIFGDDIYVLDGGSLYKISTQGSIIWSRNELPYPENSPATLCFDQAGNIFVSGIELGEEYDPDFMTTLRYTPDGEQTMALSYDDNGRGEFRPIVLGTDLSGNVYAVGEKIGKDYSTIPFVLKYSQFGFAASAGTAGEFPAEYSLKQNYPNPFNGISNFEFGIANLEYVSLRVYDILGREVATIVNEKLNPGIYHRQWDAAGLSSGVYFYKLQAGHFSETRKLMLLR